MYSMDAIQRALMERAAGGGGEMPPPGMPTGNNQVPTEMQQGPPMGMPPQGMPPGGQPQMPGQQMDPMQMIMMMLQQGAGG